MVENPLSWTDLHNAVCRALYQATDNIDAVISVLEDEPNGTTLTAEKIKAIISEHEAAMAIGTIGHSLVAKIYNAHKDGEIDKATTELAEQTHQRILWRGYEQGNTLIRQDRKPHQDKALAFLKKKYPDIDISALNLAFVMGWDACELENQ